MTATKRDHLNTVESICMHAVECIREEGGKWEPYSLRSMRGRFHALRLKDGTIWDCVNGWRDKENIPEPISISERIHKKS